MYLVFNTIGNLTSQALQVACFRNAAAHLAPGGAFVIEVGIPDLRLLPPGQTGVVFAMEDNHWGLDEYDVANQGLISHHFERVDGRVACATRSRSATRSRPSSTSWPNSPA